MVSYKAALVKLVPLSASQGDCCHRGGLGRSGESSGTKSGFLVTQAACSLAMASRVLLPDGDASENHEKSVLLAVKTELLDVKEKINPLHSFGFGITFGLGPS